MKSVSISFSYTIERDVTTKQLPAENKNEIEIEKSIFSDSSLLQSCNAALSSPEKQVFHDVIFRKLFIS